MLNNNQHRLPGGPCKVSRPTGGGVEVVQRRVCPCEDPGWGQPGDRKRGKVAGGARVTQRVAGAEPSNSACVQAQYERVKQTKDRVQSSNMLTEGRGVRSCWCHVCGCADMTAHLGWKGERDRAGIRGGRLCGWRGSTHSDSVCPFLSTIRV